MRKTFITIALLSVLGTLVVSCQKENIIDETTIVAENGKVYTVVRGGDGRKYIYCPYQGVRALKKFDWNCKFYAEDPSNINNYLLKDITIYKY